jgi:putative oxidoreductase
MPDNLRPMAQFLGRILLSLIFLLAGLGKLTGFEGTTQYMASRPFFAAMPGAIPAFAVMAIAAEVGGGLGLLLGMKARLVALLLVFFLLPTTFIFHNFWTYPPEQAQLQMTMFLKNLAIIGGLLRIAADGAGAYSIDARAPRV